MAQKEVRIYRKLLRDNGACDIEVERRKKHKVIRFSINGRKRLVTISSTPSDQRSHNNTLALLRRTMKESLAASITPP